MKIFEDISACKDLKNPVVTLGMFDGVHIGHQKIIDQLNSISEKVGGESTLLTFEPHPRLVLNKDANDLALLTTLDEKIELLKKAGLRNLILHPFTKEFAGLGSDKFVQNILVETLHVHTVVIGYDHQFGKNREGNFDKLNQLSNQLGFQCVKIEEIKSGESHISSTQIRNALTEGNLDYVANALGRNYTVSGKVVHGDKIGRTLGFPTANLEVATYKLIPQNGVYIVRVQLKNETLRGLLSIGTRPTVTNSEEKRVEVYILDFGQDIYGEFLTVELIHKIRDDKKFDSVDELIEQMKMDKQFALDFFN